MEQTPTGPAGTRAEVGKTSIGANELA